MPNNANQCKDRRRTVEYYGLYRITGASDLDDLNFILPYLGPGPYNWQEYSVWRPGHGKWKIQEATQLNLYAVSATHHAHVTQYVKLTAGDQPGAPRISDMRYGDMLADNLRAAGIPLSSIQFLGTALIANKPARTAAAEAFERAGKNILSRGVVEIWAEDAQEYRLFIARNPLARSQHDMVRKHGGGGAATLSVRRFVLISEGYDGPPNSAEVPYYEPRMHMVTELTSSGSR